MYVSCAVTVDLSYLKPKQRDSRSPREDDRPRTQCVRLAAVHRGLRISVWSMPTFSLAPSRLSSPANPTQMFGSLITWEDCDELGFGVFVFSAFCLDGEVALIQSIFEWESHQWSFCSWKRNTEFMQLVSVISSVATCSPCLSYSHALLSGSWKHFIVFCGVFHLFLVFSRLLYSSILVSFHVCQIVLGLSSPSVPDISLSLFATRPLNLCFFSFSPIVSRCFLPCSLLSWLCSVAIVPLGLRVSGYFDCVHNLIQSQHESHLGAVAQLVHKHTKSQVSGIISDWCFCHALQQSDVQWWPDPNVVWLMQAHDDPLLSCRDLHFVFPFMQNQPPGYTLHAV